MNASPAYDARKGIILLSSLKSGDMYDVLRFYDKLVYDLIIQGSKVTIVECRVRERVMFSANYKDHQCSLLFFPVAAF